MEPLQHASRQRRKRNSPRTNLVISIGVHALLFAAGAYWAAQEGMLGKELQNLTVTLVGKEKKAEPEKARETKAQETKTVQETKPTEQKQVAKAAPPPVRANLPPPAAPSVAPPPPTLLPSFSFGSSSAAPSDKVEAFKAYLESTLRSRWTRPNDVVDDRFVAEANVEIDAAGNLVRYDWLSGSGNDRWDESVRKALAATKVMGRPPPNGFPGRFLVRFDTVATTEPLAMQ